MFCSKKVSNLEKIENLWSFLLEAKYTAIVGVDAKPKVIRLTSLARSLRKSERRAHRANCINWTNKALQVTIETLMIKL